MFKEESVYWELSKRIESSNKRRLFLKTVLWRASLKDTNLQILKDLIKPNSVVYDIGGYIGYYSLTIVRDIPDVKVFTFEPNHVSYTEIMKNVITMGYERQIEVLNIALNDVNRSQTFYVSSRSARSSLYSDWAKRECSKIETSYEVVCFKMDTLIRNGMIQPPNMIKLDAEGNELLVLDGGIDTITKYKPNILVECHNNRKKLIEWFGKLGYKYQDVIKHKTEYGYALWFTP